MTPSLKLYVNLESTINMSDAQNVPKQAKYHWWYDANKAGARNAPPSTHMSGSPPISPGAETGERRFSLTSMLVGSPGANPGTMPGGYNPGRRDSLKNMYHLSDFGTPDA